MSRRLRYTLVGLVLLAMVPWLLGIGCPRCPDEEDVLVQWDIFQTDLSTEDQRGISSTFEDAPHLEDTEYYLRFVSDSLVELVYERDGQVVVETYELDLKEIEADSF